MKYQIRTFLITLGRVVTARVTIAKSNVDILWVSEHPVSPGVAIRTDWRGKNLDLCVRCRL
jgi:hypothetical protein